MKKLPLSRGLFAVIDDDCDADQFKWTAVTPNGKDGAPYAYRRSGWDNARRRWTKTIYLNRYILNAADEFDVDHVNGDTLDNRRENLRLASRSENLANRRHAVGGCGYRGVVRAKDRKNFVAQCSGYIGTYPTAIEAARAYDAAARQKFGEFAKANFPVGAEPISVSEKEMVK